MAHKTILRIKQRIVFLCLLFFDWVVQPKTRKLYARKNYGNLIITFTYVFHYISLNKVSKNKLMITAKTT